MWGIREEHNEDHLEAAPWEHQEAALRWGIMDHQELLRSRRGMAHHFNCPGFGVLLAGCRAPAGCTRAGGKALKHSAPYAWRPVTQHPLKHLAPLASLHSTTSPGCCSSQHLHCAEVQGSHLAAGGHAPSCSAHGVHTLRCSHLAAKQDAPSRCQ